ncbi:MAG: hypothetical protein MUC31_04885 [Bacteroidales bacterium]|jgi:hypothetical protein|nr:hypothetical protein [Bacteroidales bacterium]
MTDFKVIIGDYISNASHDVYEDCSFAVFDAVNVTVIEPGKMKNRTLTIYLSKSENGDSIWQQKSREMTFSLDESLLEENAIVFSHALKNIQIK